MATLSHPPAVGRYDIAAFVEDLDAALTPDMSAAMKAHEAASRLPRLLATPDLLAPEQCEPLPDRYCTHLVAIAPSKAFSVMAMIWLPGQVTPIHDHICWCVVGVLQGIEREDRYHLLQDAAGARWLQPAGIEMMTSGLTAELVPPDENIHRVRNAGDSLAISLHVYGADINAVATHSSINECFDELPIREDGAGTPVPWRSQHASD